MAGLFDKLLSIDLEADWQVEEIEAPKGGETHFRRYLNQVLKALIGAVNADQGYVAISGLECGQFTPFVAIGRELETIRPKPTSGGNGVVPAFLAGPEAFRAILEPAPDENGPHLAEVKERVLIKLIGHGELFGFICLDRRRPYRFDEVSLRELRDCVPLLTSLVAEENFSMRVRQLAGPFSAPPHPLELGEIYEEIVDRTSRGFAADGTVLRIYHPEFESLVVEARRGDIDSELLRDLDPGEGISGRVLVNPHHSWSLGTFNGRRCKTRGMGIADEDLRHLREGGVQSFIVMRLESEQPEAADDKRIGTLAYYLRRSHRFSWRDVALFRSFCQRVADTIALQRQTARLVESHENLRRQSVMMTRVEIVSLIAHDLFHKSFQTCKAIEGYVDRCKRALNNRDQTRSHAHLDDDATRALEAALRVQRSLEQLRSIQRDGAEDFERETRFDLAEVIDEIETTLNGALARNKVSIKRDFSGSLPIVGARSVLSQVFFNLVINAVDASRSRASMKPMSIHIHARSEQQGDKRRVVVQFWDEGPGIDRVAFKNPMEIFEIGRTTRPNGTGTGLPVARILLGKYFKGNLTLEDPSTARFKITLPVA